MKLLLSKGIVVLSPKSHSLSHQGSLSASKAGIPGLRMFKIKMVIPGG